MGHPLKPFCKTSYPYLSYPQISEQSIQRTRPYKILADFGMPHVAFASAILNFETLLHNVISISIIPQNFKTIRPVVTENSSGQYLSEKKKKKKTWRRRINGTKTISLPTSFGRLNPSLAEHDMPCLSKQCRSRSVGRSQLIWICTDYH